MSKALPRHALVIGGTGMLRGVCLHLARAGWMTSVVARTEHRLQSLIVEAGEAGPRINPLAVDYHDPEALRRLIADAIQRHGPVDLAAAWIHSTAPDAAGAITSVIAPPPGAGSAPCRYFDIVGSETADPTKMRSNHEAESEQNPRVLHRRVVLGFVIEANESRWLTDDEISRGVIASIESDSVEAIVGVVRPWERCPWFQAGR